MKLLTTKDVQALIHVDKSTIYRMAEDGRIPAIKVGRQWRFPASAVDQWLAGVEPSAPTGDLAELIGSPALQAVVDLAAELLGVMAVVTDMEGRPLTEVANVCGFYEAIEDLPGSFDKCVEGWRTLGDGGLAPQWTESHLGFECVRSFVRVDSRLVGMVIAGGVAGAHWPPSSQRLDEIAESLAVSVPQLEELTDAVHHLDAHSRHRVLDVLPKIADLVSGLAAERRSLLNRFGEIAALAGEAGRGDHNPTRSNQ